VQLNGCPARLFQPGDQVIILALEQMERAQAARVKQKVVHVDAANRILRVELKSASKSAAKGSKSR
ncbi:MAG: aspartate 1-decarboxylase, partial [bacterium]